ncbi:uncharacterized protein LOC134262193 [Saccostrea cucullata]|uniref:uncharacterized protein LOC134262193 n=1 Tax=Saccostrea cuccullata TaxID=36930 RepID=UPI002ED1608F
MFDCRQPTDFNYLSSYEEILELGDILRKHIDELMQYSNSSKQRQNSAVMQYINATNLVRYSFALSGSGQPWKCVSERYFKTESISPTDYLALGGCLENHQGINQLCTDPKFTDFYQMFPVTAHSHYTETYANVFCFLCNKKNIDDQILNSLAYDLDVWELIIECKTYVNYKFFNSMQAYINFVEENNCLLKFKKRRNGLNCRDMYTSDRKGVGRCNVDGSQTSLDYDILFACERSEDYRFPRVISEGILYRNKFCLICNSRKVPSTDIIDTCSSNSTTSSSLIQKACHEFPSIHVCTNFRNVFCEMCNEVYRWCFFLYDDKQEPATGPPIIPTVGPTPLGFRSVFSLLDYDNVAVKSKTTSCSSNQIYDDFQNECMNITCFPGKTLMNGSCLSLLRNTENLRYTMAVRFKFIEITSNISLYNYMVNIRKLIKRDLSYSFTGTILVEDILLMSKGNCNYRANRLDDMYMYLKIFFPFSIERDKVENQLISLTNNSVLWNNYFPDVWKVKVIPDQTSIFLPSLLWKLDREENCWLFPEKLQYGKSVFRNVLVAPLLTCNQLVMDNDAFGVPWKNIRFEYSQKGITLTFHQFQSFDNSGIRVCVDDLAYYVDTFRFRFKNEKNTSLMMLNIVCIGISLVCLLLTFVTYASFKSLRTIPGLNNMFLISSLFFAQLLLIVRPFLSIKDFNTSTVFLSSLTHFFWLATFFWLQICSFHMFRVFTSRFGIDKRTDCHKNTILKYILYGFGTSASIVLLNIVISVIISSGETTGYDKTSTLMTHRTAFIVTLICPLTYVCLTNIIFYISAVYKILSSPHIENSTGNRIHFSVYIKLFSITGLTWVLQIVDMFLTVSFLSYIVAILNGLQGLFIFISYVCNIRVCKMWISIFRTLSSTSSNSNSILHSVRSETTAL